LGEKHGDGPSVGYELLFGQVTRAQGLFSPRSNHIHFSLEYVAENLEAPTTVLQYPNRKELVRELKAGYEYVGVSFLLATFQRMTEVVSLIREHSPSSKIVLGGYGTVLSDEVLRPYADHMCREPAWSSRAWDARADATSAAPRISSSASTSVCCRRAGTSTA
jgi:haloalkane dehalogenase